MAMPGAPRLFCPAGLTSGQVLQLPAAAARHVQVLRLQPGAPVTLFGHAGSAGGEFAATVTSMERQRVDVRVGAHAAVEREAAGRLQLAIGIPANERMDWLVEKATELGAASIQPLMTERSVVRLDGPRASRRLAHWQAIVAAACEQCGRNRLPVVHSPMALDPWLRRPDAAQAGRAASLLLSLQPGACTLQQWRSGPGAAADPVTFLCGPEGGLSAGEETRAIAAGFLPVSLGARTLRCETAALAALTLLA